MKDIDISLAFKLWDIANTTVGICVANALAFLYKCLDEKFVEKLRTNIIGYRITLAITIGGLLFYMLVIIGAHIGYEALLDLNCTAQVAVQLATLTRLAVVIALAGVCLYILHRIKKRQEY